MAGWQDLEREKSISLDASLNEKRILEEKNELLKTEKELFESEENYHACQMLPWSTLEFLDQSYQI